MTTTTKNYGLDWIGSDWLAINYLEVCDKSAKQGDKLAEEVASGIRYCNK